VGDAGGTAIEPQDRRHALLLSAINSIMSGATLGLNDRYKTKLKEHIP
jgi:hypothetical protein